MNNVLGFHISHARAVPAGGAARGPRQCHHDYSCKAHDHTAKYGVSRQLPGLYTPRLDSAATSTSGGGDRS